MGYSLCWLAIDGGSADHTCERLGLKRTGEYCGPLNAPLSAAALPAGWCLIVGDRKGYGTIRRTNLEDVSRDHDVVFCEVEEHVMYSSASFWSKGKQVWSVVHNAEEGATHLESTGQPPEGFEPIRREFLERQEREDQALERASEGEDDYEDMGVDYIFEIPLALAETLTGFKHDEVDVTGQATKFETLRRNGWLSRVLAR